MTREETKILLATIEAAFPAFFKNESRDAAKARINLWAVTFANEDAAAVNAALLGAHAGGPIGVAIGEGEAVKRFHGVPP